MLVTGERHLISGLLSVCRQCYDVVINDSSLWSLIEINYGDGEDAHRIAYQTTYARTAVTRAQNLPIDVIFNFSEWRGCDHGSASEGNDTSSEFDGCQDRFEITRGAVDVLRGKDAYIAKYWRSLRILLPEAENAPWDDFLTLFANVPMPNLVRFSTEKLDTSELEIETIHPIFKTLPSLSTVFTDLDPTRLQLTPSSLRKLSFSMDGQWESTLELLQQPELIWLAVHRSHAETSGWFLDSHDPVVFHRIKTLLISGMYSDDFFGILEFPVHHKLIIYDTSAMDILMENRTYHASLKKLIWDLHGGHHWVALGQNQTNTGMGQQVLVLNHCDQFNKKIT